jgi:holo-[acyl-carrier protein] synthase
MEYTMMKLAIGVDLIEIERVQNTIQRHGRRFLERIYTTQELAEVGNNTASLAARFAAKEAVAKALGTGIGCVSWQEIEVLHGPARQPLLYLHGIAAEKAAEQNLSNWSISLSHSQTHAVAMVVAAEE